MNYLQKCFNTNLPFKWKQDILTGTRYFRFKKKKAIASSGAFPVEHGKLPRMYNISDPDNPIYIKFDKHATD